MMQLAPGERPLAPVRGARDVGQPAGHALGLAEQSLRPAEIEHVRRAAENRRKEAGSAGQATRLPRRDAAPRVEARRPQHPVQHILVELYDECRGDLAVQPVGGQVLDELAQRQPPRVVPVGANAAFTRLDLAGAESATTGRGHALEDLAQQLAVQLRDGEAARHRAVAVVVQREPCLVVGDLLVLAEQCVLMGVDHGGVALHGFKRATCDDPKPPIMRPEMPQIAKLITSMNSSNLATQVPAAVRSASSMSCSGYARRYFLPRLLSNRWAIAPFRPTVDCFVARF